jgi:hypothetical protein
MLTKPLAAAYCGLARVAFDRAVAAGQLPDCITIAGQELWDRIALDQSLDRLTGGGQRDWRREQPLYAA